MTYTVLLQMYVISETIHAVYLLAFTIQTIHLGNFFDSIGSHFYVHIFWGMKNLLNSRKSTSLHGDICQIIVCICIQVIP